jgi:hypothetical protein
MQIFGIVLRQKLTTPHTLIETCSGCQMAMANLNNASIWLHQLKALFEIILRQRTGSPHTLYFLAAMGYNIDISAYLLG